MTLGDVMQCETCAAPADDLTPGDFDGLVIRCKHCGEYEIAGTVLNALLRLELPGSRVARATTRRAT